MKIVESRKVDAAGLVRTMLVLENYEWIRQEAAAIGVEIVPIKGIDLLKSLYQEHLNRPVRDIDVLCHSEADCKALAERLCEKEYRLEFPFSLQHEALTAKQKVSLLSCSPTKVNVDIHTAFVTKKFFSQTIGRFNSDALHRCHDGCMEPLDRWLFLAQHAAFHIYSDDKWVLDLRLLFDAFTHEQHQSLYERACSYGFRRVTAASLWHCYHGEPTQWQALEATLRLTASERRFMRFVSFYDRPFTHRAIDRLVATYWEFVFMDRRSHRWQSWLRLILPTKGMLTNIYRIKHPSALLFFYPLNILVSGFTSLLFWSIYSWHAFGIAKHDNALA